jgi:hypothetical protein
MGYCTSQISFHIFDNERYYENGIKYWCCQYHKTTRLNHFYLQKQPWFSLKSGLFLCLIIYWHSTVKVEIFSKII